MSGVSASHLVIFIASVVVAAGVAGTIVTEGDRVSSSIADQTAGVSDRIDADVQIISDTGQPDAIYDDADETLVLYVKNTGAADLRASAADIDVLIDGRFHVPANVTRMDGGADATAWPTGAVVEVVVDGVAITSGEPTRITVTVAGNDDAIRIRT
jgi:flagellar protein FlaG